MSNPSVTAQIRRGILAGAILATASLFGQPSTNPTMDASKSSMLAARLRPGEWVGDEQIVRESLQSGTNEFQFVVPSGFLNRASTGNGVTLARWELHCVVSIRILEGLEPSLLSTTLRERISREFAPAGKLEDYNVSVASRPGTGYQCWQETPNAARRLVRVIWVPFKAGLLEFTLNVDSSNVRAGEAALDMILLTFCSNEEGPIQVIRRYDKT